VRAAFEEANLSAMTDNRRRRQIGEVCERNCTEKCPVVKQPAQSGAQHQRDGGLV